MPGCRSLIPPIDMLDILSISANPSAPGGGRLITTPRVKHVIVNPWTCFDPKSSTDGSHGSCHLLSSWFRVRPLLLHGPRAELGTYVGIDSRGPSVNVMVSFTRRANHDSDNQCLERLGRVQLAVILHSLPNESVWPQIHRSAVPPECYMS